MANVNQLLQKLNLSLDDLNTAERETLMQWAERLKTKQIQVSDIKEHITALIDAVNRELAGFEAPPSIVAWLFQSRRQLYLRARLKNYMMLQDFAMGPERAEKWIESQLSNLK